MRLASQDEATARVTGVELMWEYKTDAGTFYIVERLGRFHIMFEDQDLGGYDLPEQAADHLTSGHTFSPTCGLDPAALGVPEDISGWTKRK